MAAVLIPRARIPVAAVADPAPAGGLGRRLPYPESLEIPGARLERWDAGRHLPAMVAVAAEPDAISFLATPRDWAGQAATAARYAAHWESYGFGRWAILPAGSPAAGWVGAFHPLWHPEFHERVEVGWGLAGPARGRGFATAGARAAINACFSSLDVDEVLAFIHRPNAASRAVAERVGMRPAGTTTDPGRGTMLDVFALRREDLPPREASPQTTPGRPRAARRP